MNTAKIIQQFNNRLVEVFIEADEVLTDKINQDQERGEEAVGLFNFLLSSLENFLTIIKKEVESGANHV